MNLRKTFFILPNLFTLSSVFCGFFAIVSVTGGERAREAQLHQAAIAIIFGVFFDVADGRVARLTKTQSALGMQLDSLADVITFGVAPAVMMYRWGLDSLRSNSLYLWPHLGQNLGLVVAFIYVACSALRLARFNALAIAEEQKPPAADGKKKPGKYFLGLPVPAAAGVLVSLLELNHQIGGSYVDVGQAALAAVVMVLSYLMVSRVRFRSFKDLKLSRRTLTIAGFIVTAAVVAVFFQRVPSGFVLVSLLGIYLGLGLFEEVVFYRRRRDEEKVARAPRNAVLESDGGAQSDEEVLEELGAYDEARDEAAEVAAAGGVDNASAAARG